MTKIKLENVTKLFVDKKHNTAVAALYNVNLTIEKGQFAIVFGPSGSGKSTLIKAIAGLHNINEGSIYFDGILQEDLSVSEKGISLVSQKFILYPNMTIFENLAYPLKATKIPVDEIRQRVNHIANLFGLSFLLSRKPKLLSGGQQQTVSIAKALITDPKILLLDEPLSNLDALGKNRIIELLKSIRSHFNLTIIMVTHQVHEVSSLGDLFIEFENGTVKQTIRNRYDFYEYYKTNQ